MGLESEMPIISNYFHPAFTTSVTFSTKKKSFISAAQACVQMG